MHEAVKRDMRVGTRYSTQGDLWNGERSPSQLVRKTQVRREPEQGDERPYNKECDQRSSDVSMQEGVNRIATIDKVVEGFTIDQHIGGAKGEETDVARCCCVQQRSGAEVEWSDGHMRRNASRSISRLMPGCLAACNKLGDKVAPTLEDERVVVSERDLWDGQASAAACERTAMRS